MDQPIVYIFPNASMYSTIAAPRALANWPYMSYYVPIESKTTCQYNICMYQ